MTNSNYFIFSRSKTYLLSQTTRCAFRLRATVFNEFVETKHCEFCLTQWKKFCRERQIWCYLKKKKTEKNGKKPQAASIRLISSKCWSFYGKREWEKSWHFFFGLSSFIPLFIVKKNYRLQNCANVNRV